MTISKLVAISLHLIAFICIVIVVFSGNLYFTFNTLDSITEDQDMLFQFFQILYGIITVVYLVIAIMSEIVIFKMMKGKKWAWATAIVIAILIIPLGLIILSIPLLIGLFKEETRKKFN